MKIIADEFHVNRVRKTAFAVWKRNLLLESYARFLANNILFKLQKKAFQALRTYAKYRAQKHQLVSIADSVYLSRCWTRLRYIYDDAKAYRYHRTTRIKSIVAHWRKLLIGRSSTREKTEIIWKSQSNFILITI
jgi:hypothetical protein